MCQYKLPEGGVRDQKERDSVISQEMKRTTYWEEKRAESKLAGFCVDEENNMMKSPPTYKVGVITHLSQKSGCKLKRKGGW